MSIKINNLKELELYEYEIIDKENILNNKIKEELNKKGLSQADLAKLTGLSRQVIGDLIQNKLKPGVDIALKISKVLNVSVEDIFMLDKTAWYTIAKNENGSTLFIDLYEMKIIDNEERKRAIDENKLCYILIENNLCITEDTYKKLLNEYIKENYNQNNMKKDLISQFNQNVVKKRYFKLVKKIIPIQNSK